MKFNTLAIPNCETLRCSLASDFVTEGEAKRRDQNRHGAEDKSFLSNHRTYPSRQS